MGNLSVMKWSSLLAIVTIAMCGCDGAESELASVTQKIVPGPAVSGYLQGLTCGLGYVNRQSQMIAGQCEGHFSQPDETAAGFEFDWDGDRGLPDGEGFVHQAKSASDPGITRADPMTENTDQLMLPKGTACGFKETCNDPFVTCMGLNPAVQCPLGWSPRIGSDIRGSSGCNFAWCEYQDPNNLCLAGSACAINLPRGIACGINDDDRNTGSCFITTTTPGSTCENGYQKYGFYDDGRGATHGIGWCTPG